MTRLITLASKIEAYNTLKEQEADLVRKHLEGLRKQKDELWADIYNNCDHPDSMLIIDEIHEEDEIGARRESWDRYDVHCTICYRHASVNKAAHKKSLKTFSQVLRENG